MRILVGVRGLGLKSLRAVPGGNIFVASFFIFATLAVVGVILARLSNGIAVFWPPNAAMVALCLIYGLRNLPSVLIGALLGNFCTLLFFGDPSVLVFGLPFANALEILLVSLGLHALKLDVTPIETPKKFLFFFSAF